MDGVVEFGTTEHVSYLDLPQSHTKILLGFVKTMAALTFILSRYQRTRI